MTAAVARRRVTLSDLEAALAEAWARETSADASGWSDQNTAWGQCAVTALIVQDFLGGSLLRGEVGPISHYWNVLPSGERVDLTWVQFEPSAEIEKIEPRTRDYVLSHADTARRYRELAKAVRRHLKFAARAR
jgi:hypothetical protein